MTSHAKVYGGSLYELASEEQLSDAILEQMIEIKKLFRENPDYLKLLCEPSIKKEERLKMIEDAFGTQAERYLVSFLKMLCERNLLREYEGTVEEFTQRYNSDHNIAEATVISAVALSDSQTQALKAKLEKMSGKTISLSSKLDPSVIGGIKVMVEGKELDGTVMGRLDRISRKLDETII